MLGVAKQSVEERLLRSRIEVEELRERDLKCPNCEFRLQTVYSDITGHLRIKCNKCKQIHVLNLAYFRRIKKYKERNLFDTTKY